MRKLETLAVALLGIFALGTMAWADGPTKGDSGLEPNGDQSPSWIARLFADDNQGPPWRVKAKRQKDRLDKERLENESAKKAVRKQSDRDQTEAKKSKEETAKREQDAAGIKREQAEYLRRLAVCDQLREVALKNNDESLNRQADDLQAQTWAVYSKHVAGISAGKEGGENREDASKISRKDETHLSAPRKTSPADVSFPIDSQSVDTGAKEEKP